MSDLKTELREHLAQIIRLAEFRGENPFKIRAFRNARDLMKNLTSDQIQIQAEAGSLTKIKGIGKGIEAVTQDFLKSGDSEELQRLLGDLPRSFLELFEVQGLGPKKLQFLYQELGIKSLGELEYACNENRLVQIKGFGPKTQSKVLEEIKSIKMRQGKKLLSDGLEEAAELSKKIKTKSYVEPSGALARKLPIVDSLEFLVEADGVSFPKGATSKKREERALHFQTQKGTRVTFHLVSKPSDFFVRQVFHSSSVEHWKSLEKAAQKQKMLLSETELKKSGKKVSIKSPEELYEKLGLAFHPEECREYAARKKLSLVSEDSIRGVFHAHTTYSDGANSLLEMQKACENKGYDYLGISEHSQTAFYAHGLEPKRLQEQWKEIDELNAKSSVYIFKGIESDILKDGSLDYPQKTLAKFDFVIASIHQRYGMTDMTKRLLAALDHPMTSILGHMSGRLLLARDAYAFDVEKVLDFAIKRRRVVELNSNPHRLDLDWKLLKDATADGLLISINPDAHSISGLEDLRYGLWMARKGLVPPKQIINTWPKEELQEFFLNQRK